MMFHEDETKEEPAVHEARSRGLLKAMIEHFSSTPLDPTLGGCSSSHPSELSNSIRASSNHSSSNNNTSLNNSNQSSRHHRSRSILTDSERSYLEGLLLSGTVAEIEEASKKLANAELFFPAHHSDDGQQEEEALDSVTRQQRRDSRVQQQLFRLHETKNVQPSRVLHRMTIVHRNSILQESTSEDVNSIVGDDDEDHDIYLDWDPFQDVTSWLDGSQGVEVTDSFGSTTTTTTATTTSPQLSPTTMAAALSKSPFKILGTFANDTSCHPHVLSPPLMESLLAFCPEQQTSNHNFWLKYSLVRDGGGLYKLLRQVRASTFTFLAIETTDGHVLGSFTSLPWRLSQGWYGNSGVGGAGNESCSFLWRMRRCRLEATRSIVQQVCQESEIQVYPYRGASSTAAVQYCSKQDGIRLGQKELLMPSKPLAGTHYGHGLCLASNLRSGTTSTSETFGNPCLIDGDLRGARFDIANLEVWTLTPHNTVASAEQSELSNLFLDGGRASKKLNFMNILVGQPI